MRMCSPHWSKMRAAIAFRGLSGLVQESCAYSAPQTVDMLWTLPDTDAEFDPLLVLCWHVCRQVVGFTGPWAMEDRQREDGMPANKDKKGFNHLCPLCLVQKDFNLHNTKSGRCWDSTCALVVEPGDAPWDEQWVECGADAMLIHARELNLVTVQ